MRILIGSLVSLNCAEEIPVWIVTPGEPLGNDYLAGYVNNEDIMLVLRVNANGTTCVLSKFGIVWIVTYFIAVKRG